MTRHLRYSLNILPFVTAILVLMIVPRLEKWLMPVVSDFVVASVWAETDAVFMTGYMRKARDCTFVGVQAVTFQEGHEHDVPLVFLDTRNNNATRPPGTQAWGPWMVTVRTDHADAVKLTATHRCHPFYTTDTVLATVPLRGH